MKFLLDANIVIAILEHERSPAVARLSECDDGDVGMSIVTYAEVALGSMRNKPPLIDVLDRFTAVVPVLDFDRPAALAYAGLPFRRARFDRLVAAHARSRQLILVTDNVADFADVEGLEVQNWLR